MTLILDASVTTYHPTGTLASMEGGPRDRFGRPLVTVEESLETGNPFSIACDYTQAWAVRDRLVQVEGVATLGRLCDTGGHFHGPVWDCQAQGPPPHNYRGKVLRWPGREPFDLCCQAGGKFARSWGGLRRCKVTLL